MNKKILSYCLWGNNALYIKGALKNIELSKKIYPDFICRFYVSKDFDTQIIKQLAKDSEVFVTDEEGSPQMMMTRFLPAGEDGVDVFLSRDTDSRPGPREKAAVDEWLASDKKLHVIRDHPYHNVLMLGGMWGLKNTKIDIEHLIYNYKNAAGFKNEKNCDQIFLWDYIWPLFKQEEIMIHDEFFGGNKIPFPRENDPYSFFIGECIKVDENNNDHYSSIEDREIIKKVLKK